MIGRSRWVGYALLSPALIAVGFLTYTVADLAFADRPDQLHQRAGAEAAAGIHDSRLAQGGEGVSHDGTSFPR